MNILLTGSTGFIGRHILAALILEGHNVTVCVRKPTKQIKHQAQIHDEIVDFTHANSLQNWLLILEDIDIVINSVGIIQETQNQTFNALHKDAPSALFQAAEKAGIKRVIQLSALGADSQASSQYHLSKRAADDVLRGLSLDWFILRPSIVYGRGAKSMGFFRALAALPIVPLMGDGDQRVQPVYIDDLVKIVLLCLHKQTPANKTIDVVGPDAISIKALLIKQRNWLGLGKMKTITIPIKWVIKLMPLSRWMREPALSADNIAMLQRGNTADSKVLEKRLKFRLKSMDSVLQTQPPSPADYWYARLYFMRPLLQCGLAFVWIWTAFASAIFTSQHENYQLLERLNISGIFLPISLYGAALLDLILGAAMFFYQPLRHVLMLQITVIITYTLLISVYLPEYWLHPFGEITKNIPMLLAILVLYKMEDQ